jgi:CheY-like chemotaxis protein
MAEPAPRVLLVEDEPMIAFALEDMVIELGYDVVGPAFHLGDALELASHEEFAAAVLDVNLNEQRSFAIADLLHERGIPFVFATGYAEGGVGWTRDAMVIAKPYTRAQLAKALGELLD